MQINPSEVTKILKEQIKKVWRKSRGVRNRAGTYLWEMVLLRVYGLDNVQAGEMVEFSDWNKRYGFKPWEWQCWCSYIW